MNHVRYLFRGVVGTMAVPIADRDQVCENPKRRFAMRLRLVSRVGWLVLILAWVPLGTSLARVGQSAIVIFVPPPLVVARPPIVVQRPAEAPWVPIPLPESPRVPPPPARCYAQVVTCPLEQVGRIGGPCTCPTSTGQVAGRSLIPPSSIRALKPSSAAAGKG
jgi:hypothetical protein